MIKQMVQWEGFDGQQTSRTFYFNLTRYEIAHDMELEVLEQRFQTFQDDVIGDKPDPTRKMTPPEIREMLDIFKVIVKHAYGIRSSDGKRFTKNEEVWNEFVETGAFDAFIWYMFEDAKRADNFMNGIWPKEVQEAANKIRNERPDVQPVPDLVETSGDWANKADPERDDMNLTVDPQNAPDDNIPEIESSSEQPKVWSDYTKQELLDMDDISFQQLMMRSREGRNIPKDLQQIGMQRMSGGSTEE